MSLNLTSVVRGLWWRQCSHRDSKNHYTKSDRREARILSFGYNHLSHPPAPLLPLLTHSRERRRRRGLGLGFVELHFSFSFFESKWRGTIRKRPDFYWSGEPDDEDELGSGPFQLSWPNRRADFSTQAVQTSLRARGSLSIYSSAIISVFRWIT